MKRLLFIASLAASLSQTVNAQPAGISYVYGNGQMGTQLSTIAPIVVFVYDQAGRPVANSPVIWTVTQGAPGLVNPPPQTTLSDVNGYATSYIPAFLVDPSQSFTLVEVDARGVAGGLVKFLFTSLATAFFTDVLKPAEDQNRTLNTTVGKIERAAYQVTLTAAEGPQAGQPIPNVGLRVLNVMPGLNPSGFYDFNVGNDPRAPSATCVNNTLSDASGTATCDMEIGPRTGTTKLYVLLGENRLMPVLTLNVGLGAPARLSTLAGSGQTGKPGDRLAVPLRVHATDSGGNATPNATVGWRVVSGSAIVAASATITDASGDSSNAVTLGAAAGQVRIRAQITESVFADFDLAVVLGVSNLQVVSGDDQSALTGAAFSNALVVRATDATGSAVPAVPVAFSITGGSLSTATVMTNTSGVASVNATAGPNPGPLTVTASAQGFQAVFQKLVVYAPGPRLTAAGIRNAASGEPGLTPCGLATISGSGLAPGVDGVIRALDFNTTTLGPVDSIAINGVAAFIRSVSNVEGREEVAMQTPCSASIGQAAVDASVQGVTGSAAQVDIKPVQPGVFEVADDGGQRIGWATHGDGTAVNSASPATRGEVIRIFATGLGPFTDPSSLGDSELSLLRNLILGINDAGVPLLRSGYLLNQPGLYFVEVAIPADFAAAATIARFVIAMQPSSGGESIYSNTVAIPVR